MEARFDGVAIADEPHVDFALEIRNDLRPPFGGGLRVVDPEHGLLAVRHVVALRMVSNLLSGAGYWIVMLGADVLAEALVASVVRHRPDVVCLSATMPALSVIRRRLLTVSSSTSGTPRPV